MQDTGGYFGAPPCGWRTSPVVHGYSLATIFEVCATKQRIPCFTVPDLSAVIASANANLTFTASAMACRPFSDSCMSKIRTCSLHTPAAGQCNKMAVIVCSGTTKSHFSVDQPNYFHVTTKYIHSNKAGSDFTFGVFTNDFGDNIRFINRYSDLFSDLRR